MSSTKDPDVTIFETDLVIVGRFRCPVDHPKFRDSGPIRQSCMVFPRSSVVIEHEGQRPFVGDPALATLYNTGQRYERRAVSAEGDRCDWYAVSTNLLCDAVRGFDEAAADDPPHAMRYTHAPVAPEVYLEQRRLFTAIQSGAPPEPHEVEERVMALLGRVLATAYRESSKRAKTRTIGARAARRRVDIAQTARALLAREFHRKVGLAALAAQVGCSPFHLCRAFQQVTGSTIHAHVTALRLRAALERLAGRESLTDVALSAGFSSHSHFTAAFRTAFGVAPSRAF